MEGQGPPQGNQFWKLRSRHGRARLFSSPSDMWEAACEYFQWCDDHPLIEVDFRGKDAEEVLIPKMRAYTIHGLCRYLDCNTQYFNQFEARLKEDNDPLSNDFSLVITRIREAIFEQKFTGAAAGFLNANLISRDLGLADKQQHEVSVPKKPDWMGFVQGGEGEAPGDE